MYNIGLTLEFAKTAGFETLSELFDFALDVKMRIEKKAKENKELTDEEVLAYFMAKVIDETYDVLIERGFSPKDNIAMIVWAIDMYGENKKFTQEELNLLRSVPQSWHAGRDGFCASGQIYTICANLATGIVKYIDNRRERTFVKISKTLPELAKLIEQLKGNNNVDAYVQNHMEWLKACRFDALTCKWDKILCPNVEFICDD